METSIHDRLIDLHRRIEAAAGRAGRVASDVRLIVVSKTRTLAEIDEVLECGPYALGENRIQEALPKIAARPDVEWHLVGHLQRNKARDAVRHFAMIHSLDSARLAEALDEAARRLDRAVDVLLEVNVSGEESKYGLAPDAVEPLLGEIAASRERLRVGGLMTMAPYVADPEEARRVFHALRELRDRLTESGYRLPHLSMGMTNDFEIAVEEGATMVRVGRAVFED